MTSLRSPGMAQGGQGSPTDFKQGIWSVPRFFENNFFYSNGLAVFLNNFQYDIKARAAD